jgi:hypothetical protein
MALSSFDMNTMVYLESEQKTIQYANGHAKERWDLNDNEMSVVIKWLENRLKELQQQKEE